MASFTITIPNDKLETIINNIALQLNYQNEIEDPDTGEMVQNPESKVDFAKRAVKDYIRNLNKAGAVKAQLEITRKQIIENSDIDTSQITVD